MNAVLVRLFLRVLYPLGFAGWVLVSLAVFAEPVIPGSAIYPATPAPERILWDRTPIPITLPVGQERIVHFPAPVRIGVPAQVDPLLRTLSVEGSVYWQATQPFDTVRVQVTEVDSARHYLIDLQAREGGSTAPVQIMRSAPASQVEVVETPVEPPHANLNYVDLTRYAAQQMYAPARLRPSLSGVFRVPLSTTAVALMRGGAVEATPLIAWQGGGVYVTVVRLRNRSAQPLILDPRDLRGTWLAATFQHARLFPGGDEADTTCVYLISARPFEDSLRGLL